MQATKRGTVVRTYVWLKDHDYVVVLERQKKDKGDVFMLITSFLLAFEGKRRDLQSRYERRRKSCRPRRSEARTPFTRGK